MPAQSHAPRLNVSKMPYMPITLPRRLPGISSNRAFSLGRIATFPGVGNLGFSRGAMCCDERLSETKTAVARGNFGVSENFKAAGFQLANQVFEHKQVVERTAAQADPVDRRFFTQQARETHESFNESVVESATDCFRAHLPAKILDDGAE